MVDKYQVKTKRQVQISDEEREKRRERMLKLRERLKEVKEPKKPDDKPSKELEPVEEEADDAQGEVEEIDTDTEVEQEPVKKPVTKKPPTKKVEPVKKANDTYDDDIPKPRYGKKPVKKKISIKYYGDVSEYEMMNDSKMLQGLHNHDYESDSRMMDKKLELAKNESKSEMLRKQIFGN